MEKLKLIVSEELIDAVFTKTILSKLHVGLHFGFDEMTSFLSQLDSTLFLTDLEIQCLNWKYGTDHSNTEFPVLPLFKRQITPNVREGIKKLRQILILKFQYGVDNYNRFVLLERLNLSDAIYRHFHINRISDLFLKTLIETDIHTLTNIKIIHPKVYQEVENILHSFGCEFEHRLDQYTLNEQKELLYVTDLLPMDLFYLIVRNMEGGFVLKDFLTNKPEDILKFKGVGQKKFQQILDILHSYGFYFNYEMDMGSDIGDKFEKLNIVLFDDIVVECEESEKDPFVNFKEEYEKLKQELVQLKLREKKKMEEIERRFGSLDRIDSKIKEKQQALSNLQDRYADDEDVKRFLLEK